MKFETWYRLLAELLADKGMNPPSTTLAQALYADGDSFEDCARYVQDMSAEVEEED